MTIQQMENAASLSTTSTPLPHSLSKLVWSWRVGR